MAKMERAEFEFLLRDSMTSSLKSIMSNAGMLDSKLKQATSSSGGLGMLKSMVGGNLIAGGIQSIATGMKDLASFAIGAGADMEKARIGYQTLVGDVAKGNKLFEETTKFANVTPFQTDEVQKAGRTLLAFGVKADDVMSKMNLLGDVSALSNRSFDDMAMIYGKIVANGKLMGAELNMLIDAGFNPLQQMAEDTGESMTSLKKRMSQGSISVEDVNQAFANATGEGGRFNNGMKNISQTIGGKWSTFMGELKTQIGSIIEENSKFFTSFIDGMISSLVYLKSFINWMKENAETIKTVTIVLGGLILAYTTFRAVLAIGALISAVTTAMSSMSAVTMILTAKQWLLNTAMMANPIGLVIGLVVGLIAVFTTLYNTNDKVRGFFDGVWSGIKKFGDNITKFVKNIFAPFVEAWDEFKKGNYGASFGALTKGLFNLTPGGMMANAMNDGDGGNLFTGVGDAYNDGKAQQYRDAMMQYVDEEKKKKKESAGVTGKTDEVTDKSAGYSTANGTKDKAKDKSKSSVTGASSGRPTHINVEIGSLVDNFNVHAQNLEQIQRQVKDAVSRALTSAVNDVNLIAQ